MAEKLLTRTRKIDLMYGLTKEIIGRIFPALPDFTIVKLAPIALLKAFSLRRGALYYSGPAAVVVQADGDDFL